MSIIEELKAEAQKLLGEAAALEHKIVDPVEAEAAVVEAEPAKVEDSVKAEISHVESEAKAEVAETVVETAAEVDAVAQSAANHIVHVAGLAQEYVDENALVQEWKPKS